MDCSTNQKSGDDIMPARPLAEQDTLFPLADRTTSGDVELQTTINTDLVGDPEKRDNHTTNFSITKPDLMDGSLVVPLQEETDNKIEQNPNSEERITWNKKADFLLSIIGFAVDLANVWRFPYLCYKNGGGVFLIPYFLMLIFGAVPLFYMELALGQYNKQGPISIWKICPLFKGVGYCACLVSWYVSFYYNVIIGWTVYFIFASFSSDLPWIHCGNEWNTEKCRGDNFTQQNYSNLSVELIYLNKTSPVFEFFNRGLLELHLSTGLHDLGAPKWQLVMCVLVVFVILFFALFKGVKSSGKVVWVTATVPYFILTILLIRGLLLPGAGQGLVYYLNPDFSQLLRSQVWIDAAAQVFYSVGVGFGVHLTYASYNPFHNNCYKDCLWTTAANSFTSFYGGFVIFAYLGYISHKERVPITHVAKDGYGLIFQVYPEAIATLSGGPFWAVLFFTMLLTLGLDSAMGGLESVITGLKDEYAKYFVKWRYSRQIFTAGVLATSFCIAIINVTRGGGYMMYWFDTYAAGISLICSAFFEAVGIAWVYGLDRFCKNIEEMLGFQPGIYWRLCWKFISPTFLLTVITLSIINSPPLTYHGYLFPTWAIALGWGFAFSSVSMVPLFAFIAFYRAPGNTCSDKLNYAITPESERGIENQKTERKRFRLKNWFYV
ncbi:sodium-dependent noradrenaline transporter-like [Centruroides sculpturatus]|uniref:sodium-dependent noradrenaline transporter-like n=1 Tax=Centruroides sculpturatus TaxID=218467 RepID=UPI000C6C9939|nr:sodium-dependent noradrenaline transporter-like [Centruroides sculpturatus]XP_023209768.1 sodium-dependent noradrenaline transporter-like [Centruroides sculpturatus]XP_023209769.1 sodium-dependent noradrenaline transporter-like [Centruroides sculpturatus]